MRYQNPETGEIWDSETGQIMPAKPEGFTDEQSPGMRGLGLGTRAVASGLTGMPAMVGDAANSLLNMVPGVNLQMPSQMIQQGMTNMGLPQPENTQERLLSAVQSGGAGGISFPAAAAKAPGVIGGILRAQPGTQTVAGGTAGLGSQLAGEAGAGPMGQVAAGLAGGIAGVPLAAAPTALSNAGMAAVRAPRPFFPSGREDIAGEVLRRQASDPNIQIPDDTGLLTTGQATRDMGLMSFEKTARGLDDIGFANRDIAQNERNTGMLGKIAGTADDITAMETAREQATRPMREQAIKGQSDPVNTKAIEDEINRIMGTEAGERDIVSGALNGVSSKLRTPGKDVAKGELKTDMSRLYGIRKHINDQIEGKGETPASRYAKRELINVRNVLDDELNAVSPVWKDYLNQYSTMSRDIDRIKTLQDIQAKTQTAVPDVTTQGTTQVLSRPKWKSQVTRKMSELDLTPDQKAVLSEITKDLDVTAPPRALRQAGSDTFRNMSSANVLGNMFNESVIGNKAFQTITAPMKWVYKLPDEAITELLTDAMLDPSMAKKLMNRPTVKNMRDISADLKGRVAAGALGTSTGLMGEMNGN